MSRKRTVVITGGAGFLGSHLCDRFLSEGCKVVAVDNLVTGNLDNIRHLKNDKNFDFLKHDICKPFKVAGPVDDVLDFASPASPVDYMNLPIETLMVGSYGTQNSLDLAKAKKARFMIASTSEVYGDPEVHPQREDYWGHVNPIGPRSCYDEAKRFAEAITSAYRRCYKMDTKILRIFNTYGPRMRINDGRVVPNLVDQALRNKPLTVYGNGKQTRSFCFYSDLVDGIWRLQNSNHPGPMNIGNPDEFTILEFAQLVIALSDTKSKIVYKPLPKDDPKQRKPDITQAKKVLGWTPKIKLRDGLKITMDWFQAQRTS